MSLINNERKHAIVNDTCYDRQNVTTKQQERLYILELKFDSNLTTI